MKLVCQKCKHEEETSMELYVKIIGGALPIGGFWAWVTYLLAGTGFALPIVIAMILGGTGMLVFKDDIVKWLSKKGFRCPNCGETEWNLVK